MEKDDDDTEGKAAQKDIGSLKKKSKGMRSDSKINSDTDIDRLGSPFNVTSH